MNTINLRSKPGKFTPFKCSSKVELSPILETSVGEHLVIEVPPEPRGCEVGSQFLSSLHLPPPQLCVKCPFTDGGTDGRTADEEKRAQSYLKPGTFPTIRAETTIATAPLSRVN